MKRQLTALVLIAATGVNPLLIGAAGLPPNFVAANRTLPPVVANVLPILLNPSALTQPGVIPGISSIAATSNTMTINQDKPRTVIDWKSFNIGSNAWVYFKQQKVKTNSDGTLYIDQTTLRPVWEKQVDWIALNLIHDLNPSQIYGGLNADGKVYLINQNGILFGPNSQINVHSLIASTLKLQMMDSDFLNPATPVNLAFKGESYQTDAQGVMVPFDPASAVSNQGTIKTDDLGSVFLLAPRVENAGSISSPMGQIGLVAGTDLALVPDTSSNSTRTALVAKVNGAPGLAVNQEVGMLEADNGLVGMYGGTVQQQGIIRSITAVKVNGQIELKASNLVQTGVNSRTETPPDTSTEKVNQTFPYNGGTVLIGGVESDDPAIASVSVKRIDHQGMIYSPSGTVTMKASERTTLETGSTIDVSGVWVDKPAGDRMISVMLGSVVLRDAQQQKNGVLTGQTVTVDPLTGSSIGDISGSLTSQDLTTRERSVNGGTIAVSAPTGDIVSGSGSKLIFSGGGFRYGSGETTSPTWLMSGNKGYNISAAPAYLAYASIASTQTFTQSKWGITKSYTGLYLGGASPVSNTISNYVEGADAGSATLSAKRIDLYGNLDGHVTRGYFQNLAADLTNSLGQQITLGRAEPVAGTLTIGNRPLEDPTVTDLVVDSITVSRNVLSQNHMTPTPDTPQVTELSAPTLNAAGLGAINLFANNTITLDAGAQIAMDPGGAFTARARRIEQRGEIDIPGGSVTLRTGDNMTPIPTDPNGNQLVSKVYLDSGSRISVAGERLDLRLGNASGNLASSSHISGGTVTLQDDTDAGVGTIIRAGASVDVSGGYLVDAKGKATGGNAGTLALQGDALIIEGNLQGAALVGRNGGKIILHAGNVEVTPNVAPLLAAGFTADTRLGGLSGKLLLTGDRFIDSGFTSFDIRSRNDLVVDPGAALSPSTVRVMVPDAGSTPGAGAMPTNSLAAVTIASSSDYLGASSVTLAAGVVFAGRRADGTGNLNPNPKTDAAVVIGDRTAITTGPGGQVSVISDAATLGRVTIAGKIETPGGKITVRSGGDVILKSGAQILASGYVNPATGAGVLAASTPLPGGTITIKAINQDLLIEQGTRIDVSAAGVAIAPIVGAGGGLGVTPLGSDPGSVTLSFGRELKLAGIINGKPSLPAGRGSTLTLVSTSDVTGLSIDPLMVEIFVKNGFDALTLGSRKSLTLSGPLDLSAGRSVTLDAPELVAQGADGINIKAPWIRLANSSVPLGKGATAGNATLTLQGDWIDISGQVALTGFSSVQFDARRDIRLFDTLYPTTPAGGVNEWHGALTLAGDLTLKADRIYPGMQPPIATNIDPLYNPTGDQNFVASSYAITSGGKITTLPSSEHSDQPVYSAGGALSLTGHGGIENRGVLAAPLGTITLASDGRVYLAEGSMITTAGSGQVPYGVMDADNKLNITGKNGASTTQTETAPGKSINISGSEIIAKDGASLDLSGGGSVFSYQFQPGIEGSFNPLTIKGRWVILPGNPVSAPGEAIYLNGVAGTHSGVYTLLPEQYAFLPGAMVVTDLGPSSTGIAPTTSKEGFPVTTGYATVAGTGIATPQLHTYSVRPAGKVLKEGNFSNYRELIAGNGGDLNVVGATAVFNGVIKAAPLPSDSVTGAAYQGGMISLSGPGIALSVTKSVAALPSGFSYDTLLTGELGSFTGTMNVVETTLNSGFRKVALGQVDASDATKSTKSVTIGEMSTVAVPVVTLAASDTVTLKTGARIDAVASDGSGSVTVQTGGTLTVESGGQLHASDSVGIDAAAGDFKGVNPMKVDHGVLTVAGDRLFLAADGYPAAHSNLSPGLYITESLWNENSGGGAIILNGRKELTFLGDVTLAMSKDSSQKEIPLMLTLDSALIGVQDPGGKGVDIYATGLTLKNSGNSALSVARSSGLSSALNFHATDATIIPNTSTAASMSGKPMDLNFSNFGSVNFFVTNDLAFAGVGRIMTGGGNLNLTANRITTKSYRDAANLYQVADVTLDAGAEGTVGISRSTGGISGESAPGGSLLITAKYIEQSGVVDVAAGRVNYTASGGVNILAGGKILSQGVVYPGGSAGSTITEPGGQVMLSSSTGAIVVAAGAAIDVSAAGTGDAGSVTLSAPVRGVAVSGTIAGVSANGNGGVFTLDTNDLSGFDSGLTGLNKDILTKGGFTGGVDIRTRTASSLTLQSGELLKAREVKISVDKGNLELLGKIDASTQFGGQVELYAGDKLTLSGAIDAHATGSDVTGGNVILGAGGFDSSNNPVGLLKLAGGSINVSGNGSGSGGSVTLRAPRSATTVNAELNGAVSGADKVIVEAFKIYDRTSLNAATIAALKSDTQGFMSGADAESRRLGSDLVVTGGNASSPLLRPGIEVRSSGDLNVASAWDLTGWRYGGIPGNLTLRAAGNLSFTKSLTDAPTSPYLIMQNIAVADGWNYSLAAGSDLTAADPLAIRTDRTGAFSTTGGEAVYSENGNIRFASGGDTVLAYGKTDQASSLRYSLATSFGDIRGVVGGSLLLKGSTLASQAAIQSATGAISLAVAGDLNMLAGSGLGAIRTTGVYDPNSAAKTDYWKYSGGGAIKVDVGGRIIAPQNVNAWDSYAQVVISGLRSSIWSARYETRGLNVTTAGLATMGGGDMTVRSGGDISGQIGVFGAGSLEVRSGGDLSGRLLAGNSSGLVHVMGNVGLPNDNAPLLETFTAPVTLLAQGDVTLGTIANPSVATRVSNDAWNLGYGTDTAVTIVSRTGDVKLTGESSAWYGRGSSTGDWRTRILPPTLTIEAAGDIALTNSFALAPSPTGNLLLNAGGNIDGTYVVNGAANKGQLTMSDTDPATVYGLLSTTDPAYKSLQTRLFDPQEHYAGMVAQRSDTVPAVVTAGGDIRDIIVALDRRGTVTAGRDISNVTLYGQNNQATYADAGGAAPTITPTVTTITAGRDIFFSSVVGSTSQVAGIFQGGPGALTIQAGNDITLGTTRGIQSYGNFYNSGLGVKGSDVTVVAGLGGDVNQAFAGLMDSGGFLPLTPGQDPAAVPLVQRFFDTLRDYGQKASDLNNSGDAVGGKAQIETARTKLIKPLFAMAGTATGNINMTSSQISSNSDADAINIVAHGVINVGKSTIVLDKAKASQQQSSTGIYTANGGPINMLSLGDMNVNESRVMTFRGGDITMWSDQGGINAGRGSRTAINAQPPKVVRSNPNDPNSPLVVQFTPPAVGSGIAAKWYNKGLAPETPLMGNIYPFAPSGYIDAGEAGISGNKIAYYAPNVLNAGNFTAAGGPSPATGGSGVSLGSLSGAGSISQSTKSMEQVSSVAAASDQGATLNKKLMEELVASWLDVKIVGFDTPEQAEPQEGPLEKKNR